MIDPQGNFGTIDDPPGASRYTEARLTHLSMRLLEGIRENTVDFVENYSGETEEPTVLPARFPNLLVNGSQGIAVGMATNIPSHNLGEVIDAALHALENPDADSEELMRFVKGPDFPTGGYLVGTTGLREALASGRGIGEDAGGGRRRRDSQGPDRHRRHRDALSGFDRAGDGEDPDPGRGQEAFRHRRPSQRIGQPPRDPPRDRIEEGGRSPGRPQPALQEHARSRRASGSTWWRWSMAFPAPSTWRT